MTVTSVRKVWRRHRFFLRLPLLTWFLVCVFQASYVRRKLHVLHDAAALAPLLYPLNLTSRRFCFVLLLCVLVLHRVDRHP